MFTGIYTAIVTPLKDGKVDELAFERLIKAQRKGGVDGIVPVGTTGESPTLSSPRAKPKCSPAPVATPLTKRFT
jgi:dihydrodipicolinate synthase/N-acetylneuraminate lyase